MSATLHARTEYEVLQARLKTLLPEEYQDNYEDVQPVSMGSAGLKYAPDGSVAWDEIWGSFCDLAMAGGPPHRGRLLEPATRSEIQEAPETYRQVVEELCRGVEMVTGLAAEAAHVPGWIHIDCPSTSMAGWLARAINMENVSAHVSDMTLHLPAGPHFRMEKEIKNVITSIAKTCHYWVGHTSVAQHRAIADLFNILESESPLLQAPFSTHDLRGKMFERLRETVAADICSRTGLEAAGREYHGWLGIDCLGISPAIWMMRMVVASNALCRREGALIYVPVNPLEDQTGGTISKIVDRAARVARAQGAF